MTKAPKDNKCNKAIKNKNNRKNDTKKFRKKKNKNPKSPKTRKNKKPPAETDTTKKYKSHAKIESKNHHTDQNIFQCNTKRGTMDSLKVLYTNADQLTTGKKNELETLVHEVKPHIIAVCEVKPKNAASERIELDYKIAGYTLHSVNLKNNQDKSRVIAIFTHTTIENSISTIDIRFSFSKFLLLRLKLRSSESLLFGCIYRSPTQTESSNDNDSKLNELFKTLANEGYSHICLLGDFNYRDINWELCTTKKSENFRNSTGLLLLPERKKNN